MSAAATATWTRGRCAPTSTSASANPAPPFGTRTETKNVNSVRFVMAAIEFEARRQIDVLEAGGTIVQETRLFDPDKGVTRSHEVEGGRARLSLFSLIPTCCRSSSTDAFMAECEASLPELPVRQAGAVRGRRSASAPTTPPC